MDRDRVVQIRGTSFGSGYLVAPRLVLTAAHVVPEHGRAEVSVTNASWVTADVRWWRLDTDPAVDAALLEIPAEADWAAPDTFAGAHGRAPQRWGRFVTVGTVTPAAVMGFPRQQRTDIGRGGEVPNGRISPHGGATFEFIDDSGLVPVDTTGLDPATASRTTPMSGLSGAAVFVQERKVLVGVVRADRRAAHGARLTCTSSAELVADYGFRAVLRAATGVEPQLEPAEFTDILEPAPPKAVSLPSTLLRADAEVVRFDGRDDLLDDLATWCKANRFGVPGVRVLTGPGGQGKTRLARELMTRMRAEGWVAGQVRGDPTGLRALRATQHPLLLVVDYVESRPRLVRELLELLDEINQPLRLLLLARSRGTWEDETLVADLHETRLHALSPTATDREHAFRHAARGFAGRMAELTGRTDLAWDEIADELPAPRRRAETALAVQLAALVGLLRHVQDGQQDQPTLEAELLKHERKYWSDTADEVGLTKREKTLLAKAVAAAALCPAENAAEAGETIARLLPGQAELAPTMAEWLGGLYPSAENRYWGQLEPDRLAEHHASAQLIKDGTMLARLFHHAPDHQRVQTLTVLARSAVAHANEDRADTARKVVEQLRAVLRTVPPERPLTVEMLREHTDTLPVQSHVLRDYALDVARELSRRHAGTSDSPEALRDRAWALHNLAERYAAVGEWAQARAAASEAAGLREGLAADRSIARRAEWAESLLVLSDAWFMTRKMPEAHAAGARALELFRALSDERGEEWGKRERGLVRALINQAQVVWRLDPRSLPFDQVARSDGLTDEAVRRARDLVDQQPDLDPGLLTKALAQRGASLWRLQRHPEALEVSETEVSTARRLARENPDAYTADLAQALKGLSTQYSATSQPAKKGVELDREAIDLLRPLADALPAVHGFDLGQTLHNLAWDQKNDGDRPAAREAIDEAIALRRGLARGPYGLAAPHLAHSLYTLGRLHADADDHQAAVECFTEAFAVHEGGTLPPNADDLSMQAWTALYLARSYDVLERPTDVHTAQNKAIAIGAFLREYAPKLYTEDFASALADQSDLYRRYDRPAAQRVRLRQELELWRERATENDDARVWLAACLSDLGTSYATSAFTADRAIPRLREAYEIRTQLADQDSRHIPNLAATCADLSHALQLTARFRASIPISEHEVRLRRQLAVEDSTGQDWWLCLALLRLADGHAMADDSATAWRTVLRAAELGQSVVDRSPDQQGQNARLLRWIAATLSRCGRGDPRRAARAIPPARRSVRIYRDLLAGDPANPNRHNDLRWAAHTLARTLDRLGRHAEAADVRVRRGV